MVVPGVQVCMCAREPVCQYVCAPSMCVCTHVRARVRRTSDIIKRPIVSPYSVTLLAARDVCPTKESHSNYLYDQTSRQDQLSE